MRDALKHPVTLLVAGFVLLPLGVRPAIATDMWNFLVAGRGLTGDAKVTPCARTRARATRSAS